MTGRKPKLDDRDWRKLSFGEQVKMLEVEGYLVLPDVLHDKQINLLKAETSKINTIGKDYSDG